MLVLLVGVFGRTQVDAMHATKEEIRNGMRGVSTQKTEVGPDSTTKTLSQQSDLYREQLLNNLNAASQTIAKNIENSTPEELNNKESSIKELTNKFIEITTPGKIKLTLGPKDASIDAQAFANAQKEYYEGENMLKEISAKDRYFTPQGRIESNNLAWKINQKMKAILDIYGKEILNKGKIK